MVHIYCSTHKIEDVNRVNGYHNIQFKVVCGKINLKCKKDKNGYDRTFYTPQLKQTVNNIIKRTNLVYLFEKYNYNI